VIKVGCAAWGYAAYNNEAYKPVGRVPSPGDSRIALNHPELIATGLYSVRQFVSAGPPEL
jgi:hypothetical protein